MKASSSELSEIICVACPKGCRLEIRHENSEIQVANEGCKRGREYAIAELTDPRRMVATTVQVDKGVHPLLPVYTACPFPKGRINELLCALRSVCVTAPVHVNQVILADALGTGIDIIASRDID
jgi:CxxC motif-containing protein